MLGRLGAWLMGVGKRRRALMLQAAYTDWPRSFARTVGTCPGCGRSGWQGHWVAVVGLKRASAPPEQRVAFFHLVRRGDWHAMRSESDHFGAVDVYSVVAVRCPTGSIAIVVSFDPVAFEDTSSVVEMHLLETESGKLLVSSVPETSWREIVTSRAP
jgi:hypothetical protein